MLDIIETRTGTSFDLQDEHFVRKLSQLYRKLKFSNNLRKAMTSLEDELLALLKCRLFTIYQCVDNGKEIVASFKGGLGANDPENDMAIRVPFSPTSLAGYVALSQQPLLIENVRNQAELAAIHPRLQWDKRYSEQMGLDVTSMIVVPIKDDILLGMIQIINLHGDPVFDSDDLKHAVMVANMLARQFRSEFQSSQGPYDYLVQQRKLSSTDLDRITNHVTLYGGTVSRMLMDGYKITADEIGRSLEFYYRVPYMPFDPKLRLPAELMENLKTGYLRNNLWVPVAGNKDEAVILLSDPSNHQRIMEIQGVLNARNYVFRVGLPEHILQYLDDSGRLANEVADVVGDALKSRANELAESEQPDDPEVNVASSATIQLVNRIITDAEKLGASDIHIEPGKDQGVSVVRVRVDGLCRELVTLPHENVAALIARVKVMSRLDISERRLPQDGKCLLKIGGRSVELRVATIPTVQGEGAVLRILSGGSGLPMEKLNLSDHNLTAVQEMVKNPHGLILVVGPTGSGKTTTLHALLGHLNKTERKIWTAEDPVEITQAGLQQVQVQPKIGLTFAAALRSFLRADPDVILIGEMRDKETAAISVEASLTGHLVLSTLHTNSAAETITRLLDLGLDPFNFSDALLGIVAQRLMRTLCGACKQRYRPDSRELNQLIDQYGREEFAHSGIDAVRVELCRAKGCDACGGTGYKGRTGVHEVLVCSSTLQSLIYKKAELAEIRQQALKDGMASLKQDGIMKIFKGMSDYTQLLGIVAE